MKYFGVLLCLVIHCFVFGQQHNTTIVEKKIALRDSIQLDYNSIPSGKIALLDLHGTTIDSSFYQIDSKQAILYWSGPKESDSAIVRYQKYPEFLTKKHALYEDVFIVPNNQSNLRYKLPSSQKQFIKPLEGLQTSGSIVRGFTVGNNQNTVMNSNLDLQITGKLSDNITIRASLQDSNLPMQEGGYSQKIDEFDQIFIELESQQWKIRAGDLFLENKQSQFMQFNKKIQGLSTSIKWDNTHHKTEATGTVALVRGQYARSNFTAIEGNQGPYKLKGNNGELYVLVISGSERVYVNGRLLERGENKDYLIDYNAGEVIFMPTFPITADMRIQIEYQYTERSYGRYITYGGFKQERKKWSLQTYLYHESDLKNQPLQQNLTQDQANVLALAGDNTSNMVAPSAVLEAYSENKILYKKNIVDGVEIFEFTNQPYEELYSVRFSYVGREQGDYILINNQAIGKIYGYVAPINGVKQGDYSPTIPLKAPENLQMAVMQMAFHPNEKTAWEVETAWSQKDRNLFSTLDDNNNSGTALYLKGKQQLADRKWKMDLQTQYHYLHQNFSPIERMFSIEFQRDWNIINPIGNQQFLQTNLNFYIPNKTHWSYGFDWLNFDQSFSGIKHQLQGNFNSNNWLLSQSASAMHSKDQLSNTEYLKNYTQLKYHLNKLWAGASFRSEDWQQKQDNEYHLNTHRYQEYSLFSGRGDSTKVFVEVGFRLRDTDSISQGHLKRFSRAKSFYLKSKLFQNQHRDLSLYVFHRSLKPMESDQKSQQTLNSRIQYHDQFFAQLFQLQATYETSSGAIAQQEFTYIEVEPGLGVYMWNDYNGNGIQELEEFEIAPFPDQAKYVRLYLPNQTFLPIDQNKFTASFTINPTHWQNQGGFKKLLSHFYNQTSYTTDVKRMRSGNFFELNPFAGEDQKTLGMHQQFRNNLYLNRGKQRHSWTYTFLQNKQINLLSIGGQTSNMDSHSIHFAHLVKKTWLLGWMGKISHNETASENYAFRNYNINTIQWSPKITYVVQSNSNIDMFYDHQQKDNKFGTESLKQHKFGLSFAWNKLEKFSTNGEFAFLKNHYIGNATSAVGFQMLEGLQPGENFTWRWLLQRTLTQFLEINIQYQGRKSEESRAIHTGSIQLRAFF